MQINDFFSNMYKQMDEKNDAQAQKEMDDFLAEAARKEKEREAAKHSCVLVPASDI